MYNRLKIENIKTFEKKQELKIAPITLIYGENSSGKTTLLKTFDILHNIFAEREVRTGKSITEESNNFFMRRRGTENISAKKIHYYSSRVNKKKQKIEVEINVHFHKNYRDLIQNFKDLKEYTRFVKSSPRFTKISKDYWKQVKDGKFRFNEYQLPILMELDLKYFKKNKISKVNKITLRSKSNEEIISFERINKNYKEINDSREIGYISKEDKKEIFGKPSRLMFSRLQRMRRELKPDYFVDKNFYSDYKIKMPQNQKFWIKEYNDYKKIFLKNKEINTRYTFVKLILSMMSKYKSLNWFDFSGRHTEFEPFFYYIIKKFLDNDSDFQDFSLKNTENKLNDYFTKIKDPKWHDRIVNFFDNEKKKYGSIDITSKLHDINLQNYYFARYLSNIKMVNIKLLNKLYKNKVELKEYSKKLVDDINNDYLIRFAKKTIESRPFLIKKSKAYSGHSSVSTSDVLTILNLFVIGGLSNSFLEEKQKVDLFNVFDPRLKSSFNYKLLKKCMVEIRSTVNNLVICQPNKSEIPYDVMDEDDYPIEFWSAMEKIKREKLFRKETAKMDDEIRKEYFTPIPKIHNKTKLKDIDKRKIYDPMEIYPDGRNFDRVIINNETLRKELNKLLKKILNIEIKVITPKFLKKILKSPEQYKAFREAERRVPYSGYYMSGMGRSRRNKFIMLRDLKYKKNFAIHGREVGKGPANILPFLAQILSDRPNLTYLIQELENNWHPKYQAKIIEVLVENLKKSTNKFFILETHSELFVLQLKKLVQKGILNPDQVSINFVSRSENGNSEVHHLPVNKQGGFEKPWPGGFFTERMEVLTS